MTGKVANMSNYPNGFNGGLSIRGLPSAYVHPGKVYYVGAVATTPAFTNRKGSSNANKGTFLDPFATIDYAIGQCVDGREDTIVVLPGHIETITTAAGVALDVIGVTLVGLGKGDDQAQILFDAAAATVAVTAANVTISNINMKAGIADVVTAVTTTAKGTSLDGVLFDDTVAAENFLIPISQTGADNTSDGLSVVGCRWFSVDALSTEFISLANIVQGLVVDSNVVIHEGTLTAQLVKGVTGAAITQGQITNNYLSHKMTALELLIDIDTAGSGIIAGNRVRHADVTTTHDLGLDAIGMGLFDNLSTSTDAVSGFILPVIDANS